MPDENNKILKFNLGEKSLKHPFIIYANLECLLEKIDTCYNSPEKSYTEKKGKHKPSGYSLVACCSFDKTKTTVNYYRGKDCMKIFCKDLRNQAMKIINYEKKKEIILTDEEKESYENQKNCHICGKEFCTDKNNKKEFKQKQKVRDHDHYTGKYRGAAHSNCNLRYKIPREIPVIFHNRSTYDYHFVIKKLVEEFKGNFDCLGENTGKYITLSAPIKKDLDNGKTITYKLKFIDSYRFMDRPLASLIDDLSEINMKKPMDEFIENFRPMLASLLCHLDNLFEINKKIRKSKNKFIDNLRFASSSLSYHLNNLSEINKKIGKPEDEFIDGFRSMSLLLLSLVDNLSMINNKELELENKFINNLRFMIASLSCHLDNLSEINKKISLIELSEKFPSTHDFCNKDLNKFSLLLRKGVHPYEYMDNEEKFNETKLPDKESFYSELNKEGITDEDYVHAQKLWDTFNIQNLGEHHDLYVQSDTLQLADVFENFRDKYIEIYQLDPSHFLSAPGLAWQACLKRTGIELELLTDNNMLMMTEKGNRGGMCNAVYRHAKENNKYMKNYNKKY